jgi:hypothetical protein
MNTCLLQHFPLRLVASGDAVESIEQSAIAIEGVIQPSAIARGIVAGSQRSGVSGKGGETCAGADGSGAGCFMIVRIEHAARAGSSPPLREAPLERIREEPPPALERLLLLRKLPSTDCRRLGA